MLNVGELGIFQYQYLLAQQYSITIQKTHAFSNTHRDKLKSHKTTGAYYLRRLAARVKPMSANLRY
jgi:hypothetical protein